MKLKSISKSFQQILSEEEIENNISQVIEKIEKSISIQKDELLKENEALRNELTELRNFVDKKGEKRITANRQLLLLHYLDFFDKLTFQTKEKKYNLFYHIIDKTPQTVKEFLINREQPETEEYKKIFNQIDLYFISEFFNKVGLIKEANKVDLDIIKFKF